MTAEQDEQVKQYDAEACVGGLGNGRYALGCRTCGGRTCDGGATVSAGRAR
jgi:hypothetical protein